MKQVLQISGNENIGGIYRVVKDLSKLFLEDTDFRLYFLSVISADGFNRTIHNLFIVSESVVQKAVFLYRNISKFDILHFHGFNLLLIVLSFFLKNKIVYTNHGLLGTGRKLRFHEHFKKVLLIFFLRKRADKVINVSHYALNRILNEYKIPEKKLCVIYNSSDFHHSTNKHRYGKNSLIVGFHGRFVRFKRIDRMYITIKLLRDKYKLNSDILLIGEGPLKDYYKKLSLELGIKTKIVNYTQNPETELKEIDFLIIPSNEEYFGLSVIEGIRCGIITFVFIDGGGCTEIYGREYSWFVCKDEDEMASKILYCVNNPEEIGLKFAELQMHVINTFSTNNFYKNHKNCYLSLFN